MSHDEDAPEPLRAELKAAIAKVKRQIEIEQISPNYVGGGNMVADAIAELRGELSQLEDALANLPPGDP